MSDPDRFDDRLAQLAGSDETVGAARVIARAGGGGRAVALAVLNAIDESILPAELVVASEAGETMTLSVAARRLRLVVAASEDLAADTVIGQELDPEGTEELEVVIALIDRFARGAAGTVVVVEQPGEETGPRGVSATRLIGMLPEEIVDSPASELVPEGAAGAPEADGGVEAERFLAVAGPRISGHLLRRPDGSETADGADDIVDILSALADLEAETTPPGFEMWLRQTGQPDGRALGRAVWADGSVAAVAFPAREGGALAAAFAQTLTV
ncbi:hypothetical protein [Jannaschia seohaensis]|uniref:Uncharacterized protein n=1 Tax=Jannaschia seohaensis TaxID=475081 RepID=A0A2Y9B4Q5_9RHOB|nr:hypothetical protein [Jannaschia seohaensis]PWJ12504.1 hypothetical protein BCF38_11662 [Jannaschia seohaensis]SSA50985.1 hypothetical protein SAMN05421539_11662 [Jannaschia seohaensis]